MQAMEMRYLRRVEGVTRMDRLTNLDIRRRLEVEAVSRRRSGGRRLRKCRRRGW